jgi:NADH:ubiquinone oxidoreductase subunit 2 (subunit N)
VNAAIGGWYYLRIVAVMYLRQPVKPLPRSREVPALAAVVVCTIVTLALFVAPGLAWRTARSGHPTPIASPRSPP